MKRLFDIVMSLIGGVILFPVLAIVALAVVLDSGWPVFFVQKEWGAEGFCFRCTSFVQ
ncbi:hypothetical protein JCM15548_1643 [Geofilum rubicundum JCM 15548]|uniref:Bacterial sugar transferase domain-containing protein n=1 Tax=Geofilum rubicundum JCM 15548 TaxID=1236989 RepID=A0A0E9LSJ3_9BACT|nr:hypothetical protein JCM15548_1643 [Geofilum rubicundum JCM 15548]